MGSGRGHRHRPLHRDGGSAGLRPGYPGCREHARHQRDPGGDRRPSPHGRGRHHHHREQGTQRSADPSAGHPRRCVGQRHRELHRQHRHQSGRLRAVREPVDHRQHRTAQRPEHGSHRAGHRGRATGERSDRAQRRRRRRTSERAPHQRGLHRRGADSDGQHHDGALRVQQSGAHSDGLLAAQHDRLLAATGGHHPGADRCVPQHQCPQGTDRLRYRPDAGDGRRRRRLRHRPHRAAERTATVVQRCCGHRPARSGELLPAAGAVGRRGCRRGVHPGGHLHGSLALRRRRARPG